MSRLSYLLKRTLINTIKSAARKPIILIGYIFVALFIILMIAASFIMPSGAVNHGSAELFRVITTGVFAMIMYFSLRVGIDKGSTYFRMADVNMLFQAPFRPNQVLIYGFIKQIGGTLFLMMIALFQIPNLKNNFVMKPYGPAVIMLSTVMFMFAYPVFAMLMYSWSSKSALRRKVGKAIIDAAAILFIIGLLWELYQTKSIMQAAIALLDNDVIHWIPFLGWIKMVLAAAVDGINPLFWLGIGLTVSFVAAFTVYIYKMNLDYYEDVLEATEYTEAALAAKRSGSNMQFGVKVKKGGKQRLAGTGASAIFSKSVLELRKTSLFFFIDRTTIIVIAASVAFRFIMPSDEELGGFVSMFAILAFSVYMLFFFAIQGRWGLELGKPFIYLIPANPGEKLFYATLTENMKNFLDGSLLFILSGILFKSDIATIIGCILSYTMFGAVFLYGDVLSRRIFGSIHSKTLQIFIKLFFILLILIPGIVAVVAVGMMTESPFLMILAFGGWAFIAAVTMFMLSQNVFDHLEAS